MAEDVALYYGYIFNVQVSSISSDYLLQKLDEHHKVLLDDMAILESNLKMENSKEYNRSNLEDYAKLFIYVLDRYPHIQTNLTENVIVKTFFSKMQPHSFSKDLLKLDLPTIRQAMNAFHNKLHLKDIQFSENSKERQQSNVSIKKDLEVGNISKNKIPCPNCVAAGRPSGHRIWFCNNIDYCSICQSSHLAMGPDCPKRNKDTFDYDQIMNNREKKKPKDGNMSSNVSKPEMKKSNVRVTSKDSSTIASASNIPIICPVQSPNTI